jgi:hypothetical protein
MNIVVKPCNEQLVKFSDLSTYEHYGFYRIIENNNPTDNGILYNYDGTFYITNQSIKKLKDNKDLPSFYNVGPNTMLKRYPPGTQIIITV